MPARLAQPGESGIRKAAKEIGDETDSTHSGVRTTILYRICARKTAIVTLSDALIGADGEGGKRAGRSGRRIKNPSNVADIAQ
ncbi:hypothetical protein BN2476_50023 [Paraburkholderia piptadeniae]|uniref:Uncharacterized protein n=1 Tax=Paraburkholderia piptadeniae TaxID=1701573 RepID=A0A1N7RLS0_9BURK|nr:hypothetical protein BN2476_50023 [Paraburkholderia piptadeniae]